MKSQDDSIMNQVAYQGQMSDYELRGPLDRLGVHKIRKSLASEHQQGICLDDEFSLPMLVI